MYKRYRFALFVACIASCSAIPTPAPGPAPASGRAVASASSGADQRLDSIAEAYFDARLALNPVYATSVGENRYNHLYTAPFSPDIRARQSELTRAYEARLRSIDRAALDAQHQLTYDVFARTLESARWASGSRRTAWHTFLPVGDGGQSSSIVGGPVFDLTAPGRGVMVDPTING